MSDLTALCQALERTCADAAAWSHELRRIQARLRALAADVVMLLSTGDADMARTSRAMVAALEVAARACADAGRHLQESAQQGRAYVAYLVGSGRAKGTSAPSTFDPDPLPHRAADSEWWPPNEDLSEVADHVFSGHVTVGEGWRSLSGKHANAPTIPGAVAEMAPGAPADRPVEASRVYVPKGELFDEEIVKRGFSSMFPSSWPESQVLAAIREAWLSPDGTRAFHKGRIVVAGQPLDLIGGRWSGTGGGLRIKGFFDLVTGRCVSAWPVTR